MGICGDVRAISSVRNKVEAKLPDLLEEIPSLASRSGYYG